MTEAPTAAQLLADLAWLRRLAFALAGDADDADDLVQESWIAAWQRRPATDRPLRPWLGKVVRDVAAMKRRGDHRRRAREQAAHDDGHAQSPEALLETMRLHRTLVDCVLELDEPFRATIIASFVEGRSSAEIARSLAIPDSTVRWRLREGLVRLRQQLDTKAGDRKRWAPLVLALRGGAVVTTSSKLAAIVVAIIVLLLLAGTGVYVASTRSSSHEATSERFAGSKAAIADAHAASSSSSRAWWDATGQTLHPIAGRVVTSDGSAIAGATVAFYGWSAVVESAPEATLVTDASGAFRFATPHDATVYRVVATATGRAGRTVNADPRGRDAQVVIVLPSCSSTVEGTVTDSGAGPIAGAVVATGKRNLAVGPATTTSRDGHYELCVAPEIEVLDVGADGYEHVTVPITPRDRQRVDIALAPGVDVVGRVVDADSGVGVANAQVFASGRMLYGFGAAPRQALSDADGGFALTGLKAGELLLNVWSGDHVLLEPMQIMAGRHLAPIVVTMRAAAALTGIVRSEGRPVPGAKVSFDMPSARGAVTSLHVVAGADGRFVALGVVPAAAVTVRVDNMTVLAPSTIDTRHPSDIVIDVTPRPTIRGHVMHHGKPVIDAAVALTGVSPPANTTSDATGAFELAAPSPGTYNVYADSKLERAFTSATVPAVAPSDRDLIVDLDGGASITGSVVDADGKPQTGLIVRAVRTTGDDRGGAISAIDGAFTLDELAGSGDYAITIVAFADGPPLAWAEVPAPISVATGDTHVTGVRLVIANRRHSTIRGTVVDDTGAAVADAFVRLAAATEGVVRSDDAGHFSLPVFGDGPFWLVAATDWRRPSGSATGIAPGATDVSITIARSGSVRGTLVGFTQPSVTLRPLGDTYPQIARVDGSSFALGELVAGDYIIGATSADGRSASTTTHVAPGATATVTLTASSVHHVDARITTFGTGAAVPGARCFVVATAGDIVPPQFGDPNATPSISDAAGHVGFDTAPTGDAAVVCAATSQTSVGVARVAGDVTQVRVAQTNGRPGTIGVVLDLSRLVPLIKWVIPQTAAATAGVQVGDVVIAVDGSSVVGVGPDAVNTLIGVRGTGGSVSLTLLRGSASFDVKLVVGPPG